MAASIILKVNVDDSGLKALQAQIDQMNKTTINVKTGTGGVDNATNSVNNLNQATINTTNSVSDLGSAFVAKVKWGLIQTSIRAIGDAFLTAVDNMKEVDTQLTNIDKVSERSVESLQRLADTAYDTASKYGIAAGEYLEAVYEYTKAGFGETADQLGELSVKTMLVGDTTAAIADKFLIASNAAWNYKGNVEQLSLLVDQADYINNNYATTLDKIAEGMPRVASVASMAGMTAQETMAALGTITATTQETASRAGTALRALILNIIKDTTTEVEEGVTTNAEQINSLNAILEKYAGDVVKAAEATGSLIDPMEAIAALSKAYKEGLLSQQELAQMEIALGGKLRANQLDALLKNFDTTYQSMMNGMVDATGTADSEIETMLGSWESKLNILENTWTNFVQKSFNSNFFKGAVDGLTQMLNLFGDLNHMIATVSGTIAGLTLLKKATATNQAIAGMKNVMAQLNVTTAQGAKRFGELNTEVEGLTRKSARMSSVGAAITGVTVALTAAYMAAQYVTQEAQKARDEALEAAEAASSKAQAKAQTAAEEAKSVTEVYNAYQKAKEAYKDQTGTKEDYLTATENLNKALGIETGNVNDLDEAYERLVKKQQAYAEKQAKIAETRAIEELRIKAAQGKADEYIPTEFETMSNFIHIFFSSFPQGSEVKDALMQAFYGASENMDEIISKVQTYRRMLDDVDSGKGSYANNREAIAAAREYVALYGEEVDAILQAREAQKELNELAEEGSEGAKDAVDEQRESYESLADSVNKAKNAVKDFANDTYEKQGDTFKKYADAYEAFLTDWEAGFKGSTNVFAAEDLFFTDEQLVALRKKGIDAGELLASDFYKSFFTYTDSEGVRQFTKGEDMGAYAIFSMFDDKSGVHLADGYKREADQILDKNNELVASFESTFDEQGNESVELIVEDMNALADAMNIDPIFLSSLLEAIGVYHPEFEENAEGVKALADQYGRLSDTGEIDLSNLVRDLQAAGKTTPEIQAIAAKIIELAQTGEVKIDIDATDAEDAKSEVDDIILGLKEVEKPAEVEVKLTGGERGGQEVKPEIDASAIEAAENSTWNWYEDLQKINETPVEPTVHDEAIQAVKSATWDWHQDLIHIGQETITPKADLDTSAFDAKVAAMEEKMAKYKFPGLAEGTKAAQGGLTLVNEGSGPELIVEQGRARIAGEGKPTITLLQKGATVFNASDTRKIFERSGIDAFGDGTIIGSNRFPGIRRPDNSSTSNDSGTDDSGTSSSGTSYDSSSSSEQPSAPPTPNVDDLKYAVELYKSYLKWSEAANESVERQLEWLDKIKQALLDEISYLEQNGGDQTEINKLYAEYYGILSDIENLQKKSDEEKIDKHKDRVSLLKSELELLEAQDAPASKRIAKQKEIFAALSKQIAEMKRQGASEEEINKLLAEREEIRKTIHELRNEEAQQAAEDQASEVSRLKSQLSVLEATDASIDEQIVKQKEIRDAINEQIKLAKKAGATEEELNQLRAERANIDKAIVGLREQEASAAQKEASDRVSLLKSQLSLMEAEGASADARLAKQKEIREAINEEIRLGKKSGMTEEELNRLREERANIDKAIEELSKEDLKNKQEAQAAEVSRLKSQLSLMEKEGASYSKRIKQQQKIRDAIAKQIQLAKLNGASEEEINKLLEDQIAAEEAITNLRQQAKQDKVDAQADEVERLKSQLSLMEAQGASINDQINKQKEIRKAIQQQIILAKKAGASETELNKLREERLNIDKAIADLRNQRSEERVEEKSDRVSLLKSELALLEAQDASVKKRILKNREIKKALQEQYALAKKAGASQEELNKLKQEQYNVDSAIVKLEKSLYDELSKAAKNKIDELNKARDAELKTLKEKYDLTTKQNELEEKQLALQEAKQKLANAQAERNVRVWNAAKGRWEWQANAKDVESAQEAVESAQKALDDYNRQQEYNQKVDAVNDKYDKQVERWQKVIDYLEEPAITLAEAFKDINKNATKAMATTIKGLNAILKGTGYQISDANLYDAGGILNGIGGIKATAEDEMILPPILTRQMLKPINNSLFQQRMSELGYLYGVNSGMAANSGTSVGKQINGDIYQYGDITLSESQAKGTTVYELAQMARGLRGYAATSR